MVWLKQIFKGCEVPKEDVHYTCIACITIDSVMKIEKKNYPQVYLEECNYKIKKTKTTKFINTELESESELESEWHWITAVLFVKKMQRWLLLNT